MRERASAARDVALLTRELCEGLMDRYGSAVCLETVVGPGVKETTTAVIQKIYARARFLAITCTEAVLATVTRAR